MQECERAGRHLLEEYRAAVFSKDIERFVNLYTTDVRVFDTWDRWITSGRAAWNGTVAAWFSSIGDDRVDVDVADVSVVGDESFAIVTALLTYTARTASGDALRSMTNRLTWGIRREAKTWTIVHEHTSVPIRHETLKGKLVRSPV